MAKDSKPGSESLAAANTAYETLIKQEADAPDQQVQAQNASEHAGGTAEGSSGKVNPDTAPATVPEDRVDEPAFRPVDDADPVEEDKPKRKSTARKSTAKKSAAKK